MTEICKEENNIYCGGYLFSGDYSQVLLIEKHYPEDHRLYWQHNMLNGIGGKVESGEGSYTAMIREFGEETGIYKGDWHQFCTIQGIDWWVDWFWGRDDSNHLSIFNDDITMDEGILKLVSVNDLPNNTIPNVRWMIMAALDPELSLVTGSYFED